MYCLYFCLGTSTGIISGILTCVFSGVMGRFGLYLLACCAQYAPHHQSLFFSVAHLTFPQAAVLFDGAIAIRCFDVSVRQVGLGSEGRRGSSKVHLHVSQRWLMVSDSVCVHNGDVQLQRWVRRYVLCLIVDDDTELTVTWCPLIVHNKLHTTVPLQNVCSHFRIPLT